jgi:tripartite-type tricarboxylate transporter receptor subunit TctC
LRWRSKAGAQQGEKTRGTTPAEFDRFVRGEIDKYKKLVKLAGIRLD